MWRSYKEVNQDIDALEELTLLEKTISKLFIKVHRQEIRNQRFVEEDVAVALQWEHAPMRRE